MVGQDSLSMELAASVSSSDLSPGSNLEMDSPGIASGDTLPETAAGSIVYVNTATDDTVYAEGSPFSEFSMVTLLSVMMFAMVCGFGLTILLNLIGWVIGSIKLILGKGG